MTGRFVFHIGRSKKYEGRTSIFVRFTPDLISDYPVTLRLHERSLRLTYNDYESSFQDLLVKDKSVCIHYRNLQVLATLLCKVINNLTPEIIKEIFPIRPDSRYNLRSVSNFQTRNVRTVRYGTETLSFLATKILAIVPDDVKNASSIELFKEKIKACNFDNCPCRICKTYIQNIGFI